MSERPTTEQLWEQDRALLSEHGPSHLENICVVAAGLRAEGQIVEAEELEEQCQRMSVILMSDADLCAAWQRTSGEPGDPDADRLAIEMEYRGLDT